jgi:hypothetical protein
MSTKLRKISDDDYDIIDKGDENFHHIVLKASSPFPSVVFQFGKVQLIEENESLRVKYEFECFENPNNVDTNLPTFTEYIGHILVNNLEELLIFNKYKRENQE